MIIKTQVQDDLPGQEAPAAGDDTSKEEMIAECVERVMDLLKLKMER